MSVACMEIKQSVAVTTQDDPIHARQVVQETAREQGFPLGLADQACDGGRQTSSQCASLCRQGNL
ncbi:MAG: hypothetical protein FD153_739 [Rhodospirillaceae bacterium]|nr:MAG: hypothetical protein FD153_739 [Rhodospirillaceae bacterium]